MSVYSSAPRNYMISASESDVPERLRSSNLKKPIPSNIKTVSVVAQNGSQGPNGFNTFQISNSGYLMPGTTYLRCTVTVDGNAANSTWGFNGATHQASSIIRQLSVNVGSQPVELINYYNIINDLLSIHATNSGYLYGDTAIMSHADESKGTIPVATTSVDVVIPLFLSGVLNGDRAIPLWLLPNGLFIQIDYDTFVQSICGSVNPPDAATYNGTTFTVSNAQLCYQHIEVDQSYKDAVRMRMMPNPNGATPEEQKGALYQLNVNTFLNSKFSKGASATLSSTIGLNVSSLKALLYSIYNDPANVGTERVYLSRTIGSAYDFLVLLDGQRYNNQQLNTLPVLYAEMNKALSLLGDVSATYATPNTTAELTRTSYVTRGFMGGQSFKRFDEDLAMTGTPCQNCQFTLTTAGGEQAADNVVVIALYETILAISYSGDVSVFR